MGTESSKVASDDIQKPTHHVPSAPKVPTVAILGGTGQAGGYILEGALARGFRVRALVRNPEKVAHLVKSHDSSQLQIVQGSATDAAALRQLLQVPGTGRLVDVVISALGSPSNDTLVMTPAAQALLAALQGLGENQRRNSPRVLWMTAVGVNDSTEQGHAYGCPQKSAICPTSCRCCCGYGLMGCLVFNFLVPHVIGRELWEDMATSEDVFLTDADVAKRTVFVRPTNMEPIRTGDPAKDPAVFSDAWRREGTESPYALRRADEPPLAPWINRGALAKCVLDLVECTDHDGEAVSVFPGDEVAPKEASS